MKKKKRIVLWKEKYIDYLFGKRNKRLLFYWTRNKKKLFNYQKRNKKRIVWKRTKKRKLTEKGKL